MKLALYYQKALDQVRNVLEAYFLVDYLTTHQGKIAEWKAADKSARIADFGPGIIRTALDKRVHQRAAQEDLRPNLGVCFARVVPWDVARRNRQTAWSGRHHRALRC